MADYPSFDAAIEKIKELDQDDEKYLEMLNQPVLVDPTYPERLEKELGEFICHIFDQPVETGLPPQPGVPAQASE